MKNRLPVIAFLAGALWAQVYALSRDVDRERELREQAARDALKVLDRARDRLVELEAELAATEPPETREDVERRSTPEEL